MAAMLRQARRSKIVNESPPIVPPVSTSDFSVCGDRSNFGLTFFSQEVYKRSAFTLNVGPSPFPSHANDNADDDSH